MTWSLTLLYLPPPSLFLFQSLSHFTSPLSLSLILIKLSMCICHLFSLSLSLSLSLSFCLFLSLSLSLSVTHNHCDSLSTFLLLSLTMFDRFFHLFVTSSRTLTLFFEIQVGKANTLSNKMDLKT